MDPVTAFVILTFATLAVYLLMPGPKGAKPGDITGSIPKVDESKKIPVIFGRVWIKDPSIVWFGDVKTKAIK